MTSGGRTARLGGEVCTDLRLGSGCTSRLRVPAVPGRERGDGLQSRRSAVDRRLGPGR